MLAKKTSKNQLTLPKEVAEKFPGTDYFDVRVEGRVIELRPGPDRAGGCRGRPGPDPGKRVLVTGGAGFIGSHLCERLLARGDEVLCVDNFFTSRRQNIAHLRENPLFEFMRHDITWPLYVEVDRIYNLACPASRVRTSSTRCRRRRRACTARSTCSGSPSASRCASCRPPPPRCTATRRSTRRRSRTGGRSADAPQRRPRGVELHRPGAEGGADHAVRDGEPVALLLLRGRPRHRDDRDDALIISDSARHAGSPPSGGVRISGPGGMECACSDEGRNHEKE